MSRIFAALVSGLLFGFGLTTSGMVNPAKVLGFLDIAGDWDPSLAFVMATAIPVAAVGFALAKRRQTPACATAFAWPTKTTLDGRLCAGAIMFGIGWGLVGYCPGPALASLGFGNSDALMFLAAMLAGLTAFHLFDRRMLTRPRPV